MPTRHHRREPRPIPIGRQEFGLWNLGAKRYDFRDPYHLAVSVSWPMFGAGMVGLWLTLNLIFAALYVVSPGDVANARAGAFGDAFFFSIETLATVGYGVMAPVTLYGHIISAIEIVTGMGFTAIFTGLLFVRFSRPKAKILFADDAVVTMRNGEPTLMLRVANGRTSIMTNANVRLFALLAERTAEGTFLRRIYELHTLQSHLPLFVMPWMLMHTVDEASPLHGLDSETLAKRDVKLFLTIEARDQVLAATVQDIKDYGAAHIQFGMHFADAVFVDEAGQATADLSRLSMLERDGQQAA